MASRRTATGRAEGGSASGGARPVESVVVPRRSRSEALGGARAGGPGPSLEAEEGDWDFEESGIAEVPSELGGGLAWDPSTPESGNPQRRLEQALGENERLRGVQARLRRERDQAVRAAWSVRRELSTQLEISRQEVCQARAQVARLDRLRRDSARKYGDRLRRLQRQVADLRERLAAFEGLLSFVTRYGTRPGA